MKYPNCPLCNDNQLRKERINKITYWRCWSCHRRFDKDLLFVLTEIPRYKNDYLILDKLGLVNQKSSASDKEKKS